MIIPNTEQSIKHMKMNMAIAFIVLIALIVVNASLLISTIAKNAEASMLHVANNELSADLLQTKDKIESLQNINQQRNEEIGKLKASLKDSSIYLQSRLQEMDQANAYINELIAIFNQETKSSLKLPVSRSFDRTATTTAYASETEGPIDSQALFTSIEDLVQNDEISILLQEQNDAYTSLVAEVENRLSYLDRRPDYYPTSGTFTSPFGYRKDPITGRTSMHKGIDISNKVGTGISAAGAGIVTFAQYSGSYGNMVIIDHGNGYESVYAHCKSILVSPGDSVEKTQLIAKMGSTGLATGIHLHFEIRYNGSPINPLNILNDN